MKSLVVALVLTRLDYGNAKLNAKLAWLADQSLVRLQSVFNAAARLIYMSRKFDHVTPLLLCFPKRTDFNLAVLVYKCINGLAPSCILPANFIVWLTYIESTAATLGVDWGSHHPTSPLSNHRWSHFSSRGCACMEYSSIKRDVIVEFDCFQISLENRAVHAMLRRWLKQFI